VVAKAFVEFLHEEGGYLTQRVEALADKIAPKKRK
jgi:hypothetical protein